MCPSVCVLTAQLQGMGGWGVVDGNSQNGGELEGGRCGGCRRSWEGLCPSREEDLGFLSKVLQPPEGDLCYANLALQSTSTSHDPSQRKACTKPTSSALDDQREVEYITMVCTWWGYCGAWNQICHCPHFEDGLSPAWGVTEEEEPALGQATAIERLACATPPDFGLSEVFP